MNSVSGVRPAIVSTSFMTRGACDRVGHRGVRVEDRQLVDSVAADAAHSCCTWSSAGTSSCPCTTAPSRPGRPRRIVPAERAGDLRLRQVAGEVQQPAAVVVGRERVLQHAEVDVAVGTDHRRGRAVVGQQGVVAGVRVLQRDAGPAARVWRCRAPRATRGRNRRCSPPRRACCRRCSMPGQRCTPPR